MIGNASLTADDSTGAERELPSRERSALGFPPERDVRAEDVARASAVDGVRGHGGCDIVEIFMG